MAVGVGGLVLQPQELAGDAGPLVFDVHRRPDGQRAWQLEGPGDGKRCALASSRSSSRMGRMDNLTAGTAGSRAKSPKEARPRVSYPAPGPRSGVRHRAKRVSEMLRNRCPTWAEIRRTRYISV